MEPRIKPASEPFEPQIQKVLEQVMKGRPPLLLFSTLARDPRLFSKFAAGNLLDRGHLTLRQREIVIDRTTARSRAEYEWGFHIATFGLRVGLTKAQVVSLANGQPDDPCWAPEERLLIRLCDSLHETSDIGDDLWSALREQFSEEAMIELLMVAGFYRTVSYLANALRLPLETGSIKFPSSSELPQDPH